MYTFGYGRNIDVNLILKVDGSRKERVLSDGKTEVNLMLRVEVIDG